MNTPLETKILHLIFIQPGDIVRDNIRHKWYFQTCEQVTKNIRGLVSVKIKTKVNWKIGNQIKDPIFTFFINNIRK